MNIDEIKERLAKATDGPWGQMGGSLTIYKHQGGGAYWVASVFDSELPEQTANADLIAHAPTDISDLIEAVEELKERIEMAIDYLPESPNKAMGFLKASK